MMKTFIFRNNTIEFFFNGKDFSFSGYSDISAVPTDADRYIWFYQLHYGIVTDETVNETLVFSDMLDLAISQIPAGKEIIIFTLENIASLEIVASDFSFRDAVQKFNDHIKQIADKNSNIKIIDFSDFASQYKKSEIVDWKYFLTSQVPFNPKLLKQFSSWFEKKISQIELKRKKCIVLDLDNTLWGGVLGEDGISGIKIGGDYPGKAFLYFQKVLLELSKSGVILAVCSKNNEADVLEYWQKNQFNLINENCVSAKRINWNNKADNIREIALELNIGLDSMVFVDDNPTERYLVRKELPMVAVAEFPEQPYMFYDFAEKLTEDYFKVYRLTSEDKNKTASYRENAARNSEKLKFSDMDSFIKSLEIKIQIARMDDMNISRIAQMTQKTNQFNLTTKRYTEAELATMKSAKIYCISVSDKFGDSGITGCIIIKENEIDELLLSCRILGKGIEFAFVNEILNMLKNEGFHQLNAVYIPTAKNSQVKDFYEKCGFELVSENGDGVKKYLINLDNFVYNSDSKYTVCFMGK